MLRDEVNAASVFFVVILYYAKQNQRFIVPCGLEFLVSKRAMRTAAVIIRMLPTAVLQPKGSLKRKIPIKMLVIGSKVLRMDALCPPISKVPCRKRTTAPMHRTSENTKHTIQQERFAGTVKLLVGMQMKGIMMEQSADKYKLNLNPEMCSR